MNKDEAENQIVKSPIGRDDIEHLDNIELLFFAYRDFVSDPDKYLERHQFGRAHHRVLFFVNRSPGLTVAELLEILQITKQSLARVLKQLINKGYVIQTEGEKDRRKRLLYPTNAGRELILELSRPQSERIEKAFSTVNHVGKEDVLNFLKSMINDGQGSEFVSKQK